MSEYSWYTQIIFNLTFHIIVILLEFYILGKLRFLSWPIFWSGERTVRLRGGTHASSNRCSRIKRVRTLWINYLLVVWPLAFRLYFPTPRWQPVNNPRYLTTSRICDTSVRAITSPALVFSLLLFSAVSTQLFTPLCYHKWIFTISREC